MKRRLFLATAASSLAIVMSSGAFAADKTVLNFWTWAPAEPAVQKSIEAFEADNPDVDVQLTYLESTAYQDRLPLALSSGDAIDVAAVQTSSMVKLVKEYLEPLPPLFAANASAPIDTLLGGNALNQTKVLSGDDTIYIAPMGVLGSVVAYYNVSLMDELGLSVPTNREELAAFVKTIKEKKPELVPISFTGANWFLDEIANTVSEQHTPGFYNSMRYDKGAKWNSPEYKKTFDAMVGLFNDGVFGKDMLDVDYGRSVELFQQGKAVMFLQGSWENGVLSAPFRAANGSKLDNVTASGLPVMVEGGKPSIRSFIEVGLSVPKNSKNKELATKFIEFMVAGKGVDQWSTTMFAVPTKNGYSVPEGTFNTEKSKAGYEAVANLLLNPGSDRNNVSDFSVAAGDIMIDSILKGTDSQAQVERCRANGIAVATQTNSDI